MSSKIFEMKVAFFCFFRISDKIGEMAFFRPYNQFKQMDSIALFRNDLSSTYLFLRQKKALDRSSALHGDLVFETVEKVF